MISLHMKRSDISTLDVINILLASTYCGSYNVQAIEVAQVMDQSLDENSTEFVLRCIEVSDSRISNSSHEETRSLTSESPAAFLSCFSAAWVYSKVVLLGVSFLERERRLEVWLWSTTLIWTILNNGKALFNHIVTFWFVFICPLPCMVLVASFLSQLLRTRIFAVWCPMGQKCWMAWKFSSRCCSFHFPFLEREEKVKS